jgi:glutathione S-transferase
VLELFQAEWCPHSAKVRQRLTELGVDFVARQVAADPRSRRGMRAEVGEIEIPVARTEDGRVLTGEDEILAYLDEHYGGRAAPDAEAHRRKALDKAGVPE